MRISRVVIAFGMLGTSFAAQAGCEALSGRYRIQDGIAPAFVAGVRLPSPFLAAWMQLMYSPQGSRVRLFYKNGQVMADGPLDSRFAEKWTCKGSRLERRKEVTAGDGKTFRVDLEMEFLERGPAGELIHSQAWIPEGKPTRREQRVYPAMDAPKPK